MCRLQSTAVLGVFQLPHDICPLRLCTLDGVTVTSAEELESGQWYVAVGAERFKKLPYVELLLNKVQGGSADR